MTFRRPLGIAAGRRRIHGIGQSSAISQQAGNLGKNGGIGSKHFRKIRDFTVNGRRGTAMRERENFPGNGVAQIRRAHFAKRRLGNAAANAQNIPCVHARFGDKRKIAIAGSAQQQRRRQMQALKREYGNGFPECVFSANRRRGNANSQNRAGTFAKKKSGGIEPRTNIFRKRENAFERGSGRNLECAPISPRRAKQRGDNAQRRRRVEEQKISEIFRHDTQKE